MFRPTVGAAAARARSGIDVETELGRYHHLIADRLERFADQFLVGERPIGFGCIEQGSRVRSVHSDSQPACRFR
jgi:hypothetical protein